MNTREIINKQLDILNDEEFELSLIVDIYNKNDKQLSDKSKKWNDDNKIKYDENDSSSIEKFLEQQTNNPHARIRNEFVDITFNSLDFNNDKMNIDSENILNLSLKKMFNNDKTNKDYLKLKSTFISSTPKETLEVVDYLLDGCDFE